jgi:predicted RNA-binding protein with PUA-like domain
MDPKRSWILQVNPARIDVDRYLLSGVTPTVWGAPRYRDLIAVGDRAFLWRARCGTRKEPGIIGIARVVEPAEVRLHNCPDMFTDPSLDRPKPRVGLQLEEVRLTVAEGMLARAEVRRIPEMTGHPIVTSNTGSDFALRPDQAAELMARWHGLQKDKSQPHAMRGAGSVEPSGDLRRGDGVG